MNVLAFESDPLQANAIRHVVCNLVGARLTVAASLDHALRALRESSPDLVLLPALVSPTQEAALVEALRVLPNAAHIETQISTVLPPRFHMATATPQGWRRWTSRRGRPAHGVSPESIAFAERIRWALDRARERKAHGVPATVEAEAPVFEAPLALVPDPAAPVVASLPDALELELADATSRLLRKLDEPSPSDRRQFRRFAAAELPGLRSARIKFGPDVALVDVSAGGALLETGARLQPDSEAMLELFGSSTQAVLPFRVVRCQIATLDGGPRYLGACAFKEPFDLDDPAWTTPGLTLVAARVAVRNAW